MRLRHRSKVMLITGASGLLGRHLSRGPVSTDWQMIAPTSSSMDITDRGATIETIHGWRPDVVVHLAYRKGDRRVIVDGSRHVAEATARARARLVHLSSDAIFAGRPSPYVEADRPDPITEYGRHKADAELAVQEAAPDAAIIRTSLLFGTSSPSPAQLELARALRTGRSPMTFYTDEYRCPAHADDVAAAIGRVAALREVTGVLNVAGPDAVDRAEYARALAQYAGFGEVALDTSTIKRSGATRPARVVLDTSLAKSLGITCRSLSEALTT